MQSLWKRTLQHHVHTRRGQETNTLLSQLCSQDEASVARIWRLSWRVPPERTVDHLRQFQAASFSKFGIRWRWSSASSPDCRCLVITPSQCFSIDAGVHGRGRNNPLPSSVPENWHVLKSFNLKQNTNNEFLFLPSSGHFMLLWLCYFCLIRLEDNKFVTCFTDRSTPPINYFYAINLFLYSF